MMKLAPPIPAADPIAEFAEWQLYVRWERSSAKWLNFVLCAPAGERKRRFHGAWNGQRLATSADMLRLRQRHPNVATWLVEMLQQHAPTPPRTCVTCGQVLRGD